MSAYNEYCEVSVEGAYINIKMIIGNQKSGIGNREPGTSSLFLIWVYITNVSKVQIGNKEPVMSLSNYNWVNTSFWLCLYHQQVGHLMILKG